MLNSQLFRPSSTAVYTLIGRDANTCADTAQVRVQVNPRPIIELLGTIGACIGETVTIEPRVSGGTGPYFYTWGGGFRGTSIQIQAQYNLELRLLITDQQRCEARDAVFIVVNAPPQVSITGPDSICTGDQAILERVINVGRPPYHYTWQDGQSNEQITVAPRETSTHTLIVEDVNGCLDTASYTLQVQAHPELTLLPEYKLKLGQSLNLIAGTQPGNYQWTPADGLSCTNCPDPELRSTQSGKYCVTVVSDGNCRSEACTEVTLDGKCQVYVPNVFSPNGDQINDAFCAYSPCIVEVQLWIYDCWGNLVFQSNPNEAQPCWDGSSRGRAMDTGMYYYRLRGVDVLGKAVDLQGSVSLLR